MVLKWQKATTIHLYCIGWLVKTMTSCLLNTFNSNQTQIPSSTVLQWCGEALGTSRHLDVLLLYHPPRIYLCPVTVSHKFNSVIDKVTLLLYYCITVSCQRWKLLITEYKLLLIKINTSKHHIEAIYNIFCTRMKCLTTSSQFCTEIINNSLHWWQ